LNTSYPKVKNVINTALKNASQFKPSTVCIFIYI
jgi:hypothetical protein